MLKFSDNKEVRKQKKRGETKETMEVDIQCDSLSLEKYNKMCESLGKERKNS